MTRDEIVKVMAKAIGKSWSPDYEWEDLPGEMCAELWIEATAALSALEAAGMRVVPVAALSTARADGMREAALATPKPCGIADPSYRDCPNMKEVGGGFDGERYKCAVCGKGYYLDYEDMK